MASSSTMNILLCFSIMIFIGFSGVVEGQERALTAPIYSRRVQTMEGIATAAVFSDVPSITPSTNPSSFLLPNAVSIEKVTASDDDAMSSSDQPSIAPSGTPTALLATTKSRGQLRSQQQQQQQPESVLEQLTGPSVVPTNTFAPTFSTFPPAISPTIKASAAMLPVAVTLPEPSTAIASDNPSLTPTSSTDTTFSDAPSFTPTTFNTKSPLTTVFTETSTPMAFASLDQGTPPTSPTPPSTSPPSSLPQAPSAINTRSATTTFPQTTPLTVIASLTPQAQTAIPTMISSDPALVKPVATTFPPSLPTLIHSATPSLPPAVKLTLTNNQSVTATPKPPTTEAPSSSMVVTLPPAKATDIKTVAPSSATTMTFVTGGGAPTPTETVIVMSDQPSLAPSIGDVSLGTDPPLASDAPSMSPSVQSPSSKKPALSTSTRQRRAQMFFNAPSTQTSSSSSRPLRTTSPTSAATVKLLTTGLQLGTLPEGVGMPNLSEPNSGLLSDAPSSSPTGLLTGASSDTPSLVPSMRPLEHKRRRAQFIERVPTVTNPKSSITPSNTASPTSSATLNFFTTGLQLGGTNKLSSPTQPMPPFSDQPSESPTAVLGSDQPSSAPSVVAAQRRAQSAILDMPESALTTESANLSDQPSAAPSKSSFLRTGSSSDHPSAAPSSA